MLLTLLSAALALQPQDAQLILQIEAQRLPPLALAEFLGHDDPATRARGTLALGRLRSVAALAPLRELLEDPEPEVRAAAAFALGLTPGGEAYLMEGALAETDPVVRAALCDALGREGTARAIPVLLEALEVRPALLQPAELSTAAALALGRLARREVSGVASDEVLSALLAQLSRVDQQARYAAAYALSQIRPADPPEGFTEALVAAMLDNHDPDIRARLLYATVHLTLADAARDALLSELAMDVDPGVRIAVARVGARLGWPGVADLLTAPELGVRLEAIAAVGQVEGLDHSRLLLPLLQAGGSLDAAEALRTAGDPAVLEAAAALSALATSPLDGVPALVGSADAYLAPERPTRLRVAAAEVSTDLARLTALAHDDGEVTVRTAAAGRLLSQTPTLDQVLSLLDAFDPVVVAMAADWLAEHPAAAAESALVDTLREGEDIDLLLYTAKALLALYSGRSPLVRKPSPAVREPVSQLTGHPEAAIRETADALAEILGLPTPPPYHHIVSVPLDEALAVQMARIKTSRGEVLVELYPEQAPLTVWNFAKLADAGFYNNLSVHRVVPDFVVQDGDPRGDGSGGPGYTIPDELTALTYREGALGMAHAGPDTGGSQWFITLSPQPHLDGVHTLFGQVVRGMGTLRDIQPGDRIQTITIERFPEPLAPVAEAP